jgi:5-(carboxyamino)imidazole ribonucleotide synthase
MPTRQASPRIGMLGGGQLAGMLARAGAPLGMRFLQLAPVHERAGGYVETISTGYDDEHALRQLADRVDVVTYESENVPVRTVDLLSDMTIVRPGSAALSVASDRWREKELFDMLGILTAPCARIERMEQLDDAAARVGLPAVLKTQRLGYDGRGQAVCRSIDELRTAWHRLGGVQLLYERLIEFDREVSVIGVRTARGEVRFYDVGENVHEHGMLRTTLVPAPGWTPSLDERARAAIRGIMEHLDYVGVMALELFQHGDDLLANEIAPRVHNTGHWTIDGAGTSQFENHLRAILDWPLGETTRRAITVMVNIVGTVPEIPQLLEVPGSHVHLYGKEPRPGRKLGHVNVAIGSADVAADVIADVRRRLEPRTRSTP